MADVISLSRKRQIALDRQEALVRRRKIEAVRRVLQCTHCSLKCEKCGTQIQDRPLDQRPLPYRFCNECAEEYVDYLERLQGKGDPVCYWRNDCWMEAWRSWIEHQGALDHYKKSKEFLELIRELQQTRLDQQEE